MKIIACFFLFSLLVSCQPSGDPSRHTQQAENQNQVEPCDQKTKNDSLQPKDNPESLLQGKTSGCTLNQGHEF